MGSVSVRIKCKTVWIANGIAIKIAYFISPTEK